MVRRRAEYQPDGHADRTRRGHDGDATAARARGDDRLQRGTNARRESVDVLDPVGAPLVACPPREDGPEPALAERQRWTRGDERLRHLEARILGEAWHHGRSGDRGRGLAQRGCGLDLAAQRPREQRIDLLRAEQGADQPRLVEAERRELVVVGLAVRGLAVPDQEQRGHQKYMRQLAQ